MRINIKIRIADKTTDGGCIYVAQNPDLYGCIAQGGTVIEARENLRLVREDYIAHSYIHGISLPNPKGLGNGTQVINVTIRFI